MFDFKLFKRMTKLIIGKVLYWGFAYESGERVLQPSLIERQ